MIKNPKLFVVGLERCGTHGVVEAVKAAAPEGLIAWHEEFPYLCKDAYHRFHGLSEQNGILAKIKQHKDSKVICEANHRFSYFVPELAAAFPDAKFLLLIREPVDTLVSRFMNLSFVPDLLPLIDKSVAKRMEDQYFHDYNKFRIRPTHKSPMLPYQFLLYELTNSIRYILSDLRNLSSDRYWILHLSNLSDEISKILNWFAPYTNWNYELAFNSCLIRHDSIYSKSDRSDLTDYARSIFEPYRGEIESEFLLALTGKGLDSSCLPVCFNNCYKAIERYIK